MTTRELERSEIWNDWSRPAGLFDAVGLHIHEGPVPARFQWHSTTPRDAGYGARSVALLQLLIPTVRAGLSTWFQLHQRSRDLAQAVDQLDTGILLCDAHGHALHSNTALNELLAQETERRRLLEEMHAVARSLLASSNRARSAGAASLNPLRDVRTGKGTYRLTACPLGQDVIAIGGAVMVTVMPDFDFYFGADFLHDHFRLTPQEIRVARLLAADKPNAAIAAELGVGASTARRHTERVLSKLGVTSRAQVGPALRSRRVPRG